MPELPEVETVTRELLHLKGDVFKAVKAHWPKSLECGEAEFKKKVVKHKIKKVFRRGKYICFEFENGYFLTIHLRMTGKVLFECSERDKNYNRVEFNLEKHGKLYFVDIRKFGRISLWKPDSFLPNLGPEPLEQGVVFKALKAHKGSREIKKVLLDQKILAGVGNIYADEALFQARIHPEKSVPDVSSQKLKKLSEVLPVILENSINLMGTTLSDYRNTRNIGGENQNYLKVYGQENEPCLECGTKIKRIVIGQRSSHFCPKCQKK